MNEKMMSMIVELWAVIKTLTEEKTEVIRKQKEDVAYYKDMARQAEIDMKEFKEECEKKRVFCNDSVDRYNKLHQKWEDAEADLTKEVEKRQRTLDRLKEVKREAQIDKADLENKIQDVRGLNGYAIVQFDLCSSDKTPVIKIVRKYLGLGLASAKAWAEKKQGIDGSFQFTLVLSDEQLDELLRDSYHKGHFHPVNI